MLKRIVSIVLVFFLIVFVVPFQGFADRNSYDIVRFTMNSMVNIPNRLFIKDESMKSNNPSKQQTRFIKKDNVVYIAVPDLCSLTRSEYEFINDNGLKIKQSGLTISLLSQKKGMFNISYEHSLKKETKLKVQIKYIKENDVIYVEPEPILSMLSATCLITEIDGQPCFMVELPECIFFENPNLKLKDVYVDVVMSGVSENDGLLTTALKYSLEIKKMFKIKVIDSVVNLKYKLFVPIAQYSDSIPFDEAYDAYDTVLCQDNDYIKNIEMLKEFGDNIYDFFDGLGNFEKYDMSVESKAAMIKMVAAIGSLNLTNDDEMMNLTFDTYKNVFYNSSAAAMYNKADYGKIVFDSSLECVKRQYIDKAIIQNFEKSFSQDTFDRIGLCPSKELQVRVDSARTYSEECTDPMKLYLNKLERESENKVYEHITKKFFDLGTGKKATRVIDTYKSALAMEKLREMRNKETGLNFNPIKIITDANTYINLKRMQNDLAFIYGKAREKLNTGEDSKEIFDIFLATIDMYSRSSLCILENINSTVAFGSLTSKEQELLNNLDEYKSGLQDWVYFSEHCYVPEFLIDKLNYKNKDTIKQLNNYKQDTKSQPDDTHNTSYVWQLEPYIEAEDIIVSDNYHDTYPLWNTEQTERPCDVYSIIQRDGQYSLIDYEGQLYNDKFYTLFSMGDYGEIILSSSTPENIDSGNDIIVSYDQSGECKIDEVYVGGRGSAGWDSFYYDNSDKAVHVSGPGDPKNYGCFTRSVNIPIWGEAVNRAVLLNEKGETLYGCYYDGDFTVEPQYNRGKMSFYSDMIAFFDGNKWGYFNGKTGEQIIDFSCNGVAKTYHYMNSDLLPYMYTEGLLALYSDVGCKYVDAAGNEIIPIGEFEEVRPVHKGLAWVKQNGKWGVIQFTNQYSEDVEVESSSETDNTAESLVNKSVLEIVELMNGSFELGYAKAVWYTPGQVYFYNDDVFPGLQFCLESLYPMDTGGANVIDEYHDKIVEMIKKGEVDLCLISATSAGKVNDLLTVSEGMKYSDLTKIYGNFECNIGGASGYVTYRVPNTNTILTFEPSDEMRKNTDNLKYYNSKTGQNIVNHAELLYYDTELLFVNVFPTSKELA